MTIKTAAISEDDLQSTILEAAKLCGWLCYHTYNAERSPSGFPDLVLLRPPEALFFELKSNTGRVTPTQREWLDALAACGLVSRVIRPYELDEVLRILTKRPAA